MNLQESFKLLEKIDAVKLYIEEDLTQKEISQKAGVSEYAVSEYLKTNNIKSKPAKRRTQLRNVYAIGTKFGQWTIISEEVKVGSDRKLYQQCQCCCGATQWKQLSTLRNGTSTKCKKCGNKTFITEDGKISVNGLIANFFNHIKAQLSTRKKVSQLDFNITPEYLEKLYEDQNHKCALSGISLELDITKTALKQNWSLDRIDSNKGYIIGNVQWVDKRINMMKQSLNQDEFLYLCKEVTNNQKNSKCS